MKTHSKNDKQTIKDHSTLIDIKTIRNYTSSTQTEKQETPTQRLHGQWKTSLVHTLLSQRDVRFVWMRSSKY